MTQLGKLETVLDDALNKKAPFKIPENGRKTLAGAMWWLALLVGLLELWLAWDYWRAGHAVNSLVDYANSLSAAYGGDAISSGLGFLYYLTLIMVAASAALLLLATPGLKAMRKAGWNLLFYGLLLNVGYGVVRMFSDYGTAGDLFFAVLGSLVGAYLLFQVRDRFMKSEPSEHKSA